MPNKLRFAIVGCGAIGKIHAAVITGIDQACLVAVADVMGENAQKFAGNYGCQAYTDYRLMFEHEKIDILCVCTPSGSRVDVCLAAAAKGIHLLVEKPLEITRERTGQIIAAAATGGVKLGCVFQMRFLPVFRFLKQAVSEGRFGTLVMGDASTKCYRSNEYYLSGGWRGTWDKEGGGALMNQGIHNVDLLRWIMGEIKSVAAYQNTLTHSIEVEDTVAASVEFATGAMGTIEASTSVYLGLNKRLEILGSEGAAIIDGVDPVLWRFQIPWLERDQVMKLPGMIQKPQNTAGPLVENLWAHEQQILDMMAAVREDRPPAITGQDGQKSVAIVWAIYESARTGKRVDLPLE